MSQVWPWLLIILLLAVAFGPLYWMRPSPREHRQARMRARARQRGLIVNLAGIVNRRPAAEDQVTAGGRIKSPEVQVAAYRLQDQEVREGVPLWCIQRGGGDFPGPLVGWQWEPPSWRRETWPAGYWDRVAALLADLPEDVLQVEAQPWQVSCYWRERANDENAEAQVDRIADCLQGLLALQIDHARAR